MVLFLSIYCSPNVPGVILLEQFVLLHSETEWKSGKALQRPQRVVEEKNSISGSDGGYYHHYSLSLG